MLNSINGKAVGKMGITKEADAKDIIEGLTNAKYHIADITVKEVRRNPAAPFTTSTSNRKRHASLASRAKQTMVVAQKLYENGHITYMRTDSVNLAASALATAHASDRCGIRKRISTRRTAPLFHKEQRRAGSARSDPPDESRSDHPRPRTRRQRPRRDSVSMILSGSARSHRK